MTAILNDGINVMKPGGDGVPPAGPHITSVSPNTGPATNAFTSFRLYGVDLGTLTGVEVGGVAPTSLGNIVLGTYVDVSFDPGTGPGVGTWDVVAHFSDAPDSTLPQAFTFNPPPTFTSITPNTGDVAGGYEVTITGDWKGQSVVGVIIGGVDEPIVSQTATTVVATTRSGGTAGLADVYVQIADSQNVTAVGAFTYTSAGADPSAVAGEPGSWVNFDASEHTLAELNDEPWEGLGAPWEPGQYVNYGTQNRKVHWDGTQFKSGVAH